MLFLPRIHWHNSVFCLLSCTTYKVISRFWISTLESAFGILPYSVARVWAVFCIFCFIEIHTQRCILQSVLYTPAYEVYTGCVLHRAVFCIPCIALRGSGTRIQKQLFHKLLSRKPDLICLPPPTLSFSDDDDGDDGFETCYHCGDDDGGQWLLMPCGEIFNFYDDDCGYYFASWYSW